MSPSSSSHDVATPGGEMVSTLLAAHHQQLHALEEIFSIGFEISAYASLPESEMLGGLRQKLADLASVRRKDFDLAFAPLLTWQETRVAEMRRAMTTLGSDYRQHFGRLRDLWQTGQTETLPQVVAALHAQVNRIHHLQKALRLARAEQEIIRERLSALLSRGQPLRLEALRSAVDALLAELKGGHSAQDAVERERHFFESQGLLQPEL